MKSTGDEAFSIKRKASALMIRWFSHRRIPDTFRMNESWVCASSTEVTAAHPRERSSNDTAPVPAKRSMAVMPSKSVKLDSTLNRFSRAKSVVGRAEMFVGTSKRRRPYFPEIIRISVKAIEGLVGKRPNCRVRPPPMMAKWRGERLRHIPSAARRVFFLFRCRR